MHLAGIQAAMELAKAKGDTEFEKRCRENLEVAGKTLIERLWTGKYFKCWWTEGAGDDGQIHIDTLYGQLWCYLLGLGDLTDPDYMRSHLLTEEQAADSPFGLQVIVNTKKKRDSESHHINDTVWQIGSITWTAMNLFLGNDVDVSMAQAEKVINHWRLKLNDQWDYRDLTAVWNGKPYCNSHYARQLMFWAIPMALVGQDYSAVDQRLSFDPKTKAPYRLPFYTPKANGVLEVEAGKPVRLRVIAGKLELKELVISGEVLAGDISVDAGDTITLDTMASNKHMRGTSQ
jgi:hypothetical protein